MKRKRHQAMLAIVSQRLEGIASKMQNTLLRTARSGVINSGRDFSCCLLTADARLLAVGESLPIHVMAGPDMMARSMMEFHPELRIGDAFLHNSPYHGCSHAADLSVLVPVIDESGVHRFTVLAKAHQADIGNSIPTTYNAIARDVYEEGALIFAATQIQKNYRDIGDIVRFCEMRIRVPEQWRGDYLASLGAARIGERELLSLGAELGWSEFEEIIEDWFDYSEQRMVSAIAVLPTGSRQAQCVHDAMPGTPADGIPVHAKITVDAAAAHIEVDLRDNIDCLPCGLNLSEACARTGAMVGVFNSLALHVPTNEGSFRRIDVLLRENCIVGIPVHPTSCSVATQNVADRLISAVHLAFAKLGDGLGMAEVGAAQTAAQAVISGQDARRDNAPFVNQVILGDTLGAGSPHEDGWLGVITTGTAGMSFFDSIEIDELHYPIRVDERRVIGDTGGAGQFRGAPSSRIALSPVAGPLRVLYQSDGHTNPARGARGGSAGGPAQNFKRDANGRLTAADGWADLELEPGETIIGVSCGGGGYGSPFRRDPERVKADVDEGYVSADRAKEDYGVIFCGNGEVDKEATAKCRSVRLDERLGLMS
jgi:N-methylhydantoinase B